MRVLRRSLVFLGAIVLILFSVSNRETISLAFWPLPFLVDLPFYLLFFLSLVIGFLIGGCATWIAGGRGRTELRRRRRRIEALERELAVTQSQLEDRAAPVTALSATRPAS